MSKKKPKRKQFLTYEDAVKTKKQHTKPCGDCPFARTALNGWLGTMSVQEWLAGAHGEMTADCHTTDKQCAGLAIYRSNVCKSLLDPDGFTLPADREKVFATSMEFMAHHSKQLSKPVKK